MGSKPPVRQEPAAAAGAGDLDPELQAQLQARAKRKAKVRKERRPKATYDLPQSVLKAIQQVAATETVSQSDIVAWAVVEFMERYAHGEEPLDEHKEPSRSLRFENRLVLPSKWR